MLNINAKIINNEQEIAKISLRILPREGETLYFNRLGYFKISKIIYHLQDAGNNIYHTETISIYVDKQEGN